MLTNTVSKPVGGPQQCGVLGGANQPGARVGTTEGCSDVHEKERVGRGRVGKEIEGREVHTGKRDYANGNLMLNSEIILRYRR